MKKVMITGASSGIGYATAHAMAALGFDLILTGRRVNKLTELKNCISKKYSCKIDVFYMDMCDVDGIKTVYSNITEVCGHPSVLINNAGLALGLSFFQEGNEEDWFRMIDTNIKGLLVLTKAVAQEMIKNKEGHIINISSIAAKQPYEKGNVYCASKAAVDSITKNMRIDLIKHNIKVSSVSPGAVNTEFSLVRFKGDINRAEKVYDGFQPLAAEDVAECISFLVTRPPHVNINDIEITPTAQANAYYYDRK